MSVLNSKDEQRHLEFSMISEKYYQMIDEFIKSHEITDSSFTNDGHELARTDLIEELAVVDEFKPDIPDGEDDEEEDEDFKGGESGSEVDEEYDSAAKSDDDDEDGEGSHRDSDDSEEEEDGVFSKANESG